MKGLYISIQFYKAAPFSGHLRGDPIDVHLSGQGRDVAVSLASGLEALEFVQGPKVASLNRGLVARELGEGVRSVSIPDKAHTKCGGIWFTVGVSGETRGELSDQYASLYAVQTTQPRMSSIDPVHKRALQLFYGLQLIPEALA